LPVRILLTNHLPLGDSESGADMLRLARGLARAGHAAWCLVGDDRRGVRQEDMGLQVRRVVFAQDDPEADLAFSLPSLFTASGSATFGALSDRELAQYREAFRRQMDAAVVALDPQVIHCQHLWLDAHLALETGVPYVATAWGPELDACGADARYQRFVDEAAQNAGRIFLPDAPLHARLPASTPDTAGRVVLLPEPRRDAAVYALRMAEHYQAVLEEWFGT
jgi:hypothetical protein